MSLTRWAGNVQHQSVLPYGLQSRDALRCLYIDKNNFYLFITFMTVRQYINKLNVRSPFASPKSRL